MKLRTLATVMMIMVFAGAAFAQKPKYEIKFASIALKKTTPINIMEELNEELLKETNGEVGFKIYPGSNDEGTIIQRMRANRIHSAGFTGRGLGAILPLVRVMELPFMFNSYEEVDYVIERVFDRFAAEFEKKGFVLLGWTEVGFVHIFSKEQINNITELKNSKIWLWSGDPLVEAMYRELGVSPVPISIAHATTSLKQGLINAVYGSPYSTVAFQWHTKTNYMSKLKLTDAGGAIIVKKSMFDKIPPNHQKTLLSLSKKWLRELVIRTRADNENSLSVMEKQGMKFVDEPTGQDLEVFVKAGERIREKLVGDLYPRELLDEVLGYLNEFRSGEK